jgi:hypothetical protein
MRPRSSRHAAFGNAIRAIREEKSLSQEQLALRCVPGSRDGPEPTPIAPEAGNQDPKPRVSHGGDGPHRASGSSGHALRGPQTGADDNGDGSQTA